MLDLEMITNMNVCSSTWNYPDQAAAFKEKCFKMLISRLKDALYETSYECDTGFITFMSNCNLKTFDYDSFQVYDANLDGLNQLFRDTDPYAIYITSILLYENIIDYNGDLLEPIKEVKKHAADIVSDSTCYDYEFGDLYIEKEDIVDAAKAYSLVKKGDYQKALQNSTVSQMAQAFSDVLSGVYRKTTIITPEQVLECLSIFLDIFEMSENYSCSIHAYSSKEIYQYMKKYRDRVPEKIRKTIDTLIDIVSCPLQPDLECLIDFHNIWDHEHEKFVVVLELLEFSYDYRNLKNGDFSGIYKSAFLTLDKALPKLRAKYGCDAA